MYSITFMDMSENGQDNSVAVAIGEGPGADQRFFDGPQQVAPSAAIPFRLPKEAFFGPVSGRTLGSPHNRPSFLRGIKALPL